MAAKTWTGLGLDELWSNGLNWNLGTVPVTTDVCTFDGTSTKACTIDNVGTFVGTITVASTYGSTITQNVALQLTGSCALASTGSTWVMNASISGTASIAISDDAVSGGTLTRTAGTLGGAVSVSDLSVLNLGTDATVNSITTVSGSTITGDGDITFVTGTTNLADGTVWDTSGVTSLLCSGSGTAAHALTIGTSETSLSGVPITVTGAGNFTFTGAAYDFNVVAVTKSGSGGITIAASADVDFGSNPTITCNGVTVAGELIASGTINYVQLSTASPVAFSVSAGGIASGGFTAVNVTGSLTINATATWPAAVVLNINPNQNTTATITATAHTFGTCTLTGSTAVALTIAAGTSITLAANQTAGFTGVFTVTGALNLLGNINLVGALTTSAGSSLTGTGIIKITEASFTMSATGTVANTVGFHMAFTGATTRTFAGAGKTYSSLQRSGAGSGQLTITGSNTFIGGFVDNDAQVTHFIVFTASTTNTFGAFNFVGNPSAGIEPQLNSSSGTNHTLSCTGNTGAINCNGIRIFNSNVDASPVWYAGADSVDGGGANVNWVFAARPKLFNPQMQIIS